jgi:tetratricopeptide (TPR) repeat protein
MATLNDRRQIGRIHISYAYLCLESEPRRFEAARVHLEKAEAALLEADAPVDLAYVFTERSRLALLEGGFEDALSYATEALDAAALIEPLEQARALFLQGRACASLGRNARARQSLEEAVAIFAEVGARQYEALAWNELAELSATEGNGKRAMKEFRAGFAALDPTRSRS